MAEPALSAGTFVPPFKAGRMTWIKPSFLWMMYRSGWATQARAGTGPCHPGEPSGLRRRPLPRRAVGRGLGSLRRRMDHGNYFPADREVADQVLAAKPTLRV